MLEDLNNTEMETENYKALNLELSQQREFVRGFNNLPEKSPATIRFFNRTDYYTVHGDDAVWTSNYLSMSLKYMGGLPKLSYICLNKAQFEKMIKDLLLVKSYRVEVYVKSGSSQAEWNLEYKGSPGNLTQFEELLYTNDIHFFTNSVICVKPCSNGVLAICNVSITESKFEVCEIDDNEAFSGLECIIAQVGPKECVIPAGGSPDLVSLKNALERNSILVAEVKRSDFSSKEIIQDLNRLLFFHQDQERNSSVYTEINLKEAMACLQAVIKFLNLTGDQRNFNQFKLNTLDARRYVRLDNAALYALNVFPQTHSQISKSISRDPMSKINSLIGILDNCVTVQGRRLLNQWIKQPLKDCNLINERLDIVQAFATDAEIRTILSKDILPPLIDLIPLSKKISSRKTNLADCYRVYETITRLPNLINILQQTNNKCVNGVLADPISKINEDLQKYKDMIEQILDVELVEKGEYLVKASFNDDLSELHRKKEKIAERMQKEQSVVANELASDEGKGVKLDVSDQWGYVFRCSHNLDQKISKQNKYKILDVLKSGIRFTSDKLTELNKQYVACNEEYEEKQKEIVEEVFEIAADYTECIRTLNNLTATVDVLVSFAVAAMSARIPYVRPKLYAEDSGKLNLKKVRHPCLEAQDNVSFIPNDVAFSHQNKIMHIVTGPNMCGKSTYIRSIGASVLMAHIGSFVPCSHAEISIVDGILVRVGADDSQLKGLSTFMLEMIETASIMKCATKNSLVIIDELGRGTSTYDGCGIAWAIAEFLVKELNSFSLFATHFHEITRLAEIYENVSNLHVTAIVTEDKITPLYQIQEGECDKSYGIHCAKMVGFPEDVIQDAIEHQKTLEYFDGMRYIANFEPRVKRQIILEGDSIIRDTLKELSVNIDKISDAELSGMLSKMKTDLLSQGNLFIKGLITTE